MKTKSLSVAILVSVVMIAHAKAGGNRGGGAGFHGGAARGGHAVAAAPVRPPMRAGGFSSLHSMPTRNFGGGRIYPGQRYSSFGMRSYRPTAFRQPSIYPNRVTITRSGPYTAATIGQRSQSNRFPR